MKSLIFSLCIFSLAAAQPPVRTIEIKGTGSYTTNPDLGVLVIEVTAAQRTAGDAVKELNKKTGKLTGDLTALGFSQQEIKTGEYSVSKNTVWENNTQVDKGYVARQQLTVEFLSTKEKIGAIISSFMQPNAGLQFSFRFTLSEKKEAEVRDELLRRAVADAQRRARVLTAASGEHLGRIIRMSYGTASPVQPLYSAMKSAAAFDAERSAGFEVKDLVLTDEVTIAWELTDVN